jgi:biotin synthase
LFDVKKLSVSEALPVSPEAAKTKISESTIIEALSLRGEEQKQLFELAREKRKIFFPDGLVEVRSVIEVSNICTQKCNFCGMNIRSRRKRYMIGQDDLLRIVDNIYSKGRRVLFFQSGENRAINYIDCISESIAKIKSKYSDLTVILCMGSLSFEQYRQLNESGADRYILKFETSNPLLYEKIKPGDSLNSRIECIDYLIELGFDVGTGNIIGLPGQTLQDIADDLFFISRFKLSMASCSVFVPGKNTVFQDRPNGDIDIALNFMALLRLMYPHMLIPTTSSLEKAKKDGQYLGLMAGANTVTVHDGTPFELKKDFPIYSTNRFIPDEAHLMSIVKRANLKFPENIL